MGMEWQEKELEDYVASNPPELIGLLSCSTLELMGRQVKCHTGIIDLMFASGLGLYIVEVKAVCADEKAVGQVVRYVEAIKMATEKTFWKYVPSPEDKAHLIDEIFPPVPVIIAPSFTQAAVDAIAPTGWPIEARREGGGFTLHPSSCRHRYGNNICERKLLPLLKKYVLANTVAAAFREERTAAA